MKIPPLFIALFIASCCLWATESGAAGAPPTERELHTALCVAALDLSTERLAAQVKAGREELRPLLVQRLRYGVALVGQSYLDGERDEDRSHALLRDALEAQKSLPEKDLAARQSACAEEGRKLLADSNALSRALVSKLADRRLQKLLGQ
jgi:hypothetical protein